MSFLLKQRPAGPAPNIFARLPIPHENATQRPFRLKSQESQNKKPDAEFVIAVRRTDDGEVAIGESAQTNRMTRSTKEHFRRRGWQGVGRKEGERPPALLEIILLGRLLMGLRPHKSVNRPIATPPEPGGQFLYSNVGVLRV